MDNRIIYFPMMMVLLKLVCFIIGYLIIRLGYKLMVSGVKGEFKFTGETKGIKGGLISSSPGLLFVLLGTILIGYAMYVDKPFSYESNSPAPAAQQTDIIKVDTTKVDSLK